jgi:hypothetical protein
MPGNGQTVRVMHRLPGAGGTGQGFYSIPLLDVSTDALVRGFVADDVFPIVSLPESLGSIPTGPFPSDRLL